MITAVLLTIIALPLVGSACGEVSTATISPLSQTVAPGQTFTVDVVINPVVPIAGAQFYLEFDPSLLTAISVSEGNLLNQDGFNTFFRPRIIDNVQGSISGVASVIITPGGTANAPGTLATITFIAGTNEGTSPLYLKNVIVGDKEGQQVVVQVSSGSVTISNQ